MNPLRFLLIITVILLSGCTAPEGVEERQSSYSDWTRKRQEVRSVRQQERDARDDMRWNRMMGRPVDDTGIIKM